MEERAIEILKLFEHSHSRSVASSAITFTRLHLNKLSFKLYNNIAAP